MDAETVAAWDGASGTAGGLVFGSALAALIEKSDYKSPLEFAQAADIAEHELQAICEGRQRIAVSMLARLAQTLRLRPIEFLQKTAILSLDVYAAGLDPLYFLPDGPIRYDARIYMREINPRHQVPEGDMTKRNPALSALREDTVLDALGKLEVELTYLLRAASQQLGGTL